MFFLSHNTTRRVLSSFGGPERGGGNGRAGRRALHCIPFNCIALRCNAGGTFTISQGLEGAKHTPLADNFIAWLSLQRRCLGT